MLIVSCDDDETATDYSQDFNIDYVFRCDGPLTADCAGEAPLSGYTQLRIFHDVNSNGPDEEDNRPVPYGYSAFPEAWFANYADFFIHGSSFVSPVFESHLGVVSFYHAFYLRAYTSDSIVWTSPKFSLYPHIGVPDTIDLPAAEWTCEVAAEEPPQCLPVPGEIQIYHDGTEEPYCFMTCPDGVSLLMYANADSTRAEELPIIVFGPSCDSEPDAETGYNPANWIATDWGNWWAYYEMRGLTYGKRTAIALDSVPCTNIDNLVVTRTDTSASVQWHSTFERECESFEIWMRNLPYTTTSAVLVGEFEATRREDGAGYWLAVPRLIPGYSYEFTIVARDDAQNRYPCKRIVSSS